jgi:hypothetical protein
MGCTSQLEFLKDGTHPSMINYVREGELYDSKTYALNCWLFKRDWYLKNLVFACLFLTCIFGKYNIWAERKWKLPLSKR